MPTTTGVPMLTRDELDDLLDLLQRMIDGEPTNPDVTSWLPVIQKLKAQRRVATADAETRHASPAERQAALERVCVRHRASLEKLAKN
jgi:hypothetical protein